MSLLFFSSDLLFAVGQQPSAKLFGTRSRYDPVRQPSAFRDIACHAWDAHANSVGLVLVSGELSGAIHRAVGPELQI